LEALDVGLRMNLKDFPEFGTFFWFGLVYSYVGQERKDGFWIVSAWAKDWLMDGM